MRLRLLVNTLHIFFVGKETMLFKNHRVSHKRNQDVCEKCPDCAVLTALFVLCSKFLERAMMVCNCNVLLNGTIFSQRELEGCCKYEAFC